MCSVAAHPGTPAHKSNTHLKFCKLQIYHRTWHVSSKYFLSYNDNSDTVHVKQNTLRSWFMQVAAMHVIACTVFTWVRLEPLKMSGIWLGNVFVRNRNKTFKTWKMQSFMLRIFSSLWSTIAGRVFLTVPAVILKLNKLVSEYVRQFKSFTLTAELFIQWKMEIIKKKNHHWLCSSS